GGSFGFNGSVAGWRELPKPFFSSLRCNRGYTWLYDGNELRRGGVWTANPFSLGHPWVWVVPLGLALDFR
ncbi:hypothetical protein CH063_11509, partial [Colletotrichum higginsianum]